MKRDDIKVNIAEVRKLLEEIEHIAYLDNTKDQHDKYLLDNILHNLEIYLYLNENNYPYLKGIIHRDWNRFLASVLKL